MSNYQRFISYMYAYEGGVKGKNIGFAKLETRGNQCRISISLKGIYAGGNPIGIYLLAGADTVQIGSLFVRNGNGEFRTTVQTGNIEGSGYSLEECYGLTIHDTESAWRCYTTIWEDAAAHAAELEEPEPVEEPEPEEEAEPEEELEEETESVEAEEAAQKEMSVQTEENAVQETQLPEPEEKSEEEIWEMLRGRYPKMLAFDYEDGCEILTVQPQDIGLLPRENWVFGGNSFLLHGYYCYRYLILARLNQKNGSYRYLLGVPGHYVSNEKYMAAMFGFSKFVLSKKQSPKSSRFGYWYRDIRIS